MFCHHLYTSQVILFFRPEPHSLTLANILHLLEKKHEQLKLCLSDKLILLLFDACEEGKD